MVTTAFFGFSVYNDALQRETINENLRTYVNDAGNLTAENITSWISGRVLLLENLAYDLNTESDRNIQSYLQSRTLVNTFKTSYLGEADGSFSMHPQADIPADYDPRTRPWYTAVESSGATLLTQPYIDASSGDLVMSIATPSGQNVVGGDLDLAVVSSIINALDFNGLGYAFLVSGDGKVLVHPDKQRQMKALEELFPSKVPVISAELQETVSVEGNRLVAFLPVSGLPGVDWQVGLSIDREKAFASLTEFRVSAFLATSIAISAIVVLLGMLMGFLLRPLTSLGAALEDIAQGEGDLTVACPLP